MRFETIPLSTEDPDIVLDAYIADPIRLLTRKAILVIPGGAYRHVCADREGEPIAHAFLARGFNTFVLKYSTGRKRPFPAQLLEAAAAIKHIKDNADSYGINPEELYITGFSAGGHLCACCGILWDHESIQKTLDMPFGYNKPKGILPIYPVINDHEDSFKNLWCTDIPSDTQLQQVKLDQRVNKNSVPAFMVHTFSDQCVPVQNTLDLACAYNKAGVPFELHIFPQGDHGFALGNRITQCERPTWNEPAVAKWVDMAVAWIDKQ